MSSSTGKKRELVTARMTVKPPSAKDLLTGGIPKVELTGRNTEWAKGTRPFASVPKYAQRVAYMRENHANHPFAKGIMERHVKSEPASDKRGLACAEGHSVIAAHEALMTAGKRDSRARLEEFRKSLLPEPVFSQNTSRQHKRTMMTKYNESVDKRMAEILSTTGMSSWDEYLHAEAQHMAWNDIQRHGTITEVLHRSVETERGTPMDFCTHCRTEIAEHMKH